jgi:hypothetical protein
MTAPLPPLPAHWFSQMTSSRTVIAPESEIKDFAKLAVREALERVDALCNEVFRPTPKDVSDKIRAMLKEYE